MKFTLIVCTFQRPDSLKLLLESVRKQYCYPDEILIVDGSLDDKTQKLFQNNNYDNLKYFKVPKETRGLTGQRNFGIGKVSSVSEIIAFLDDDTILHPDYFLEIIRSYELFPDALAISGYINNEVSWKKVSTTYIPLKDEFMYEDWVRKEGSRFGLRRKFGLEPDKPPGIMPDFSHGYSTGFLPPSGKIYKVELLMGGISTYRKEIFERIRFSAYFEGYGLYEDADFSLRLSRVGKLFVNTNALVEHHHASEGRPNMFKYGEMVVRNGWYVWRVKNANPKLKAQFKWHATSLLLTLIKLGNIVSKKNKTESILESLGRFKGFLSLIFNPPKGFES